MKNIFIRALALSSGIAAVFLFSASMASAQLVTPTNYTQTSSDVPLTSCPAGEQDVFNVGGPVCMIVYTAASTLPPGCTVDEENDLLSDPCQPELHWAYQLPNQPLTAAQAQQASAAAGYSVSPANEGWVLCTESDNYGCTGAGHWVWTGSGPPPASGPPNTNDPYQDCAAAQGVQAGATVTIITSTGSVTASPTVLQNGSFQEGLANACTSSSANVQNYAGAPAGLCDNAALCSGSAADNANPLVIGSPESAMTKTYNAIYATTQTLAQNAINAFKQAAGITSSTSSSSSTNSSCYQFTATLQLGSTGTDLSQLEQALTLDGDLTSSYSSTTFDSTIQTAVIAFQNKYASSILAPLSLVNGTGIVATNTRTELNNLCLVSNGSSSASSSTSVPTITGIQGFNPSTNPPTYTDNTVMPNTFLVVYGTFAASGNIVSVDGLAFPTSFQSTTQINVPIANIATGSHTVTVSTNGQSANTTFNVASAAGSGSFSITLNPSSGPSGSGVTILGSFPTATGALNSVSFGNVEKNAYYYSSNNSTHIYFIVPYLGNNGFFSGSPLPAGQYPITVSNANGTSSPVEFTVTN